MVLTLRFRWSCLVAIALCICCPAAVAQKLAPIPSATVRVNDNASMLTETQEASLDASFEAYAKASKTRFVLLTVASTAPEQVEIYGERVAEAWKIGHPDGAGDVIMIVARDNRGDLHRVTIEVADDRKQLLTDLLVARIIAEDMLPRFQYLDYNGGVTAAFDRIKTLLAGGVMPPPLVKAVDVDAPPQTSYADFAKLGGAIFLALLLLWFLRATRRRMTYLAGDRAINRAFTPMIVGSFIGRKHSFADEHNGFGGGYVGPGVGGYAGGGGDFSGGSASGEVVMDVLRMLRHATAVNRRGNKLFDHATMQRLQAAIARGEATHRGEVRLIVESAMPLRKVWRGMTPRQRALDLFGSFRVWDTEEKNGVLLYINLAEHALEVISDRTVSRRTRDQHWLFACQLAQEAFRHGNFEAGTIAAIDAIHQALASTFPVEASTRGTARPEAVVAR